MESVIRNIKPIINLVNFKRQTKDNYGTVQNSFRDGQAQKI